MTVLSFWEVPTRALFIVLHPCIGEKDPVQMAFQKLLCFFFPIFLEADTDQFNTTLSSLTIDLRNKAASGHELKFVTRKVNFTVSDNLYGLAQCTTRYIRTDCSYCLNASVQAVSSCSKGIMVGGIFTPNCTVRNDTLQFYTPSEVSPPPNSLPPPAGSSPPPPSNKATKGSPISLIIIN